jgi:hypothetical protein
LAIEKIMKQFLPDLNGFLSGTKKLLMSQAVLSINQKYVLTECERRDLRYVAIDSNLAHSLYSPHARILFG